MVSKENERGVDPNTDNGETGGGLTESEPLFGLHKNAINKRRLETTIN